MYLLIIALLVIALLFGPQLWASWTFKRYSRNRDDIAGSGGDLVRHLKQRFDLDISVETTDKGDHYDPESRTVRLLPKNYEGRSLTAITVAAHEVGHAIQHHRGETLLKNRTRLIKVAMVAEKLGAMAMVAIPIITLITRHPISGAAMFVVGLLSLGSATLVHLITLPVEWDASFNKALPILEKGNYVSEKDRPAARRILRAAALTYVAASLASLLNIWRWLRFLRR